MPNHKSKPPPSKQVLTLNTKSSKNITTENNQEETLKNVKWTKAKRWKLFGQTLLLLAFFSQTLLFNHYDTKLSGLNGAYRDQYMMEIQGDLKELIYFQSINSKVDSIRERYSSANITLAAEEFAKAQTMVNIGSKRTDSDKINLSNNFIQRSFQVKNFNDYLQFKSYIGNSKIQMDEVSSQIEDLNKRKDFFFKLFIVAYLLGTVCLIMGTVYERS